MIIIELQSLIIATLVLVGRYIMGDTKLFEFSFIFLKNIKKSK